MHIELLVVANSSDNVPLIYCINIVTNWFLQNSLMLNMNKTQLLNISSVFPYVIIDSITIVPCNNVKNLGFIFVDNIHFSDQIAMCLNQLIINYIKYDQLRFRISKMLIELLVMSRIHYCCSLYYGLPATSTKSLDIIIRSLIRVLHRVKLYDHESVNYHLVNYKWLNMYQRSTFRYLKLIVKVLKNRLTSYLIDILQFKVYKRNLRNAFTWSLQKRNYKISRYGKLSFSVVAADLWNALTL